MNMTHVINELRIRRDALYESLKKSEEYLQEMVEHCCDEDDLEEQRELINDQKFRLRGIIKAVQGLRDYVDGDLTK